jgi:hypothetical protein
MDRSDDLDRRFREATVGFRVEPVRWNRVARRIRWRLLAVMFGVVVVTGALAGLLAGGLLVGKSAVDPNFQSLFANRHASLSIGFDEPHAARGHAQLGQFLTETGRSTAGLSTRQLREEGFTFKVNARLVGFRGSSLLARWSVLDARTRRVVPVLFHMLAVPIRADHARQRLPLRFWVPYPARRGKYVVRFNLTEAASGSVVVARDSAPFFALAPGDLVVYRTPTYVAKLPRDWTIVKRYQPKSGRFVSLATAPGDVSVLIDTTLGFDGNSAESAETLDDGYRRKFLGYRRLVFQWEKLGTGPAFEWSFALDGVWTTDIFFVRGGNGYAVAAKGPASRYAETRAVARTVARSLRSRN